MLTASLDDIVFEGRNQAYGAYQLRRGYQRNVTRAGGITLSICGLLLAAWVARPATPPAVVVEIPVLVHPMEIEVPPVAVPEKPKQAVQAPLLAPRQAAAAPAAPAVATDKLVPPPPHEQPVEVITTDGAAGHAAPGTASALATGTTETGDQGSSETVAPAVPVPNEAFTYVEKMPEFAGGQTALLRYLRDHLRYPNQALREQAEGRVFMSFVVRADGSIAEATVLKGLGYGLDEEALRVVRQMPAWTPGYQAQHAVAVRFTLPITFKIQ